MIIKQLSRPSGACLHAPLSFQTIEKRLRQIKAVCRDDILPQDNDPEFSIIPSFYKPLSRWKIDKFLLIKMMNYLLNKTSSFRTEPVFSRPLEDGAWLRYPNYREAETLSSSLMEANRAALPSALLLACNTYSHVILSHPFLDGNGRLARALGAAALLHYDFRQDTVMLFLRLLKMERQELIFAVDHLGLTGDWTHILRTFEHVGHKTIGIRVQRDESEPLPFLI